LESLNVGILTERRVFHPYGVAGGQSGSLDENIFLYEDGRTINMGGKNEILAKPGGRIRILTPGGGGYGTVSDSGDK